jgi:hypothetical protein
MDNHEPALNSSQELSRATVAWRALCITVLLFDALVVEFISPQNETVAPPWVHLTLAFATLALNGALLICANRVGSTRVSTRSRLLLFTSVLIAVSLAAHGWMLRSHWIHAVDIDDVADMPRIVAAGVSLLLEGHHPYQHVQVPWDVPMAYQPGMFLPHVIPGLIGVDTRQAAAVASVLVPALWIIGFGRRGAWALLATTLVCLPWLCAKNQVFMPTTVQTPTWWPWCALGALLFLDGRWRSAGILWGLAAASRQHVIGAVILLALHLLRRGTSHPARRLSSLSARRHRRVSRDDHRAARIQSRDLARAPSPHATARTLSVHGLRQLVGDAAGVSHVDASSPNPGDRVPLDLHLALGEIQCGGCGDGWIRADRIQLSSQLARLLPARPPADSVQHCRAPHLDAESTRIGNSGAGNPLTSDAAERRNGLAR